MEVTVLSPPPLNIPESPQPVTVKIINTTLIQGPNIAALLYPRIKGHELYRGPSFSFLIEHESQPVWGIVRPYTIQTL
jgi:hypothetical protein